jgi:hypothetical protein
MKLFAIVTHTYDRGKDIRDGKTKKKTYTATGRPYGKKGMLELEIGNTRLRCV